MDEQYIRGINSELIRAIKALAGSSGGDTSAITSKLDSIDTHIQELTQALNTAVGTINDKQDSLILEHNYMNPKHIAPVVAGDTTFPQSVVLCNISGNDLVVTVTATSDSSSTQVTLSPGWNPIVVSSITGATENTLLYGY